MFILQNENLPIGELEYSHQEMQWVHCRWHPLEAFDGFSAFFAQELEFLETDQISEMLELWEKHGRSFNIVRSNGTGHRLDEMIIHIQGNDAWFTGDPDHLETLLRP